MTLSTPQFLLFSLLCGLLIAITLTWLRPEITTSPVIFAETVPQWFSVNATSTAFDENGQPKHQVNAARLTHFEQLKETRFNNVEAQVFEADPTKIIPPWQLRADNGVAYHKSALEEMKEMDLWGNVIIWRMAGIDTPTSEMTTEFLKFYPDEEYLQTDSLVTFRHGQQYTSGIGMEADLTTQNVKLMSTIQGRHIREE